MTTQTETADLIPLAQVEEIPDRGLVVAYPEGPFEESAILLVIDGEVRAWKNRCRHLAVRLDRQEPGIVMSRDLGWLICQEHGARYRPDSGECTAGPCVGSSLRPLEVVVRDGTVYFDPRNSSGFFVSP